MRRRLIAAAAMVALGGCTTPVVQKADDDYSKVNTRASELVNATGQNIKPEQPVSPVYRDSGVWLPAKIVKAAPRENAAVKTALARRITMNRDFQSLSEVAERVTALTGLVVNVTPDALLPDASVAQAGTLPGAVPGATPGVAMPAPGMSGVPGMPGQTQRVSISYEGTLSGFLDMVAARFNVSWEISDTKVTVFRLQTRTFVINSIPGEATLKTAISSAGIRGSSGGAGTSTTTGANSGGNESEVVAKDLSVWKSIEDSIKAMLSTSGKVVVTPAVGTATVTDTPSALARVNKFIEQQNAHLGRQVVVSVQVLSVSLNDKDDYGINWDTVYKSLSARYGFDLKSAFLTDDKATKLTLNVLGGAPGSAGAWEGSKAIISALSTQGKVSVVTSASAITLNNQPVPIQVGKQQSYLASSATTITPDVGSTTALMPGTVTTGFSMTVLPHILENNRMLMQYAIDISSLIDIKSAGTAQSFIQVPEIETRNFLQRVSMRSGDTLVLTGFEQAEHSNNRQGVGSPSNIVFGGGLKGNQNRNVIVILMRPVVMAAL